jgi:tetratricopeptide (TPR) repeat protein
MKATIIVSVLFATAAPALGAQDPLAAAKDLYAAAAFEEALSTLSRVDDSRRTPDVSRHIEEYRVFCLYALGRTAEAESAAASLIRKNPLAELDDESEASPRIREMFAEVRKRLLPELIRDAYQAAKSARDRRNPIEAERHLLATRGMLEEARTLALWNERLAELDVLVDGFLDLAQATQRAQAAAVPPPAPTEKTIPPAAPPPPAATVPARPRGDAGIFTSSDRDVSPPVAIRQIIPYPPRPLLEIMRASRQTSGVVDVLIDETGAVEDVVMRAPINSNYDHAVMMAAREWKYRPATKDGTEVKYLKTIVITISEANQPNPPSR